MTGPAPHNPLEDGVPPWRGRWALYGAGLAALGFGLAGIVRDTNGWTNPVYWTAAVVVLALAHDLVVVPAVFAVAVPLARLARRRVRPYLAAGLAMSALALAVAWPGLRGYGRLDDNAGVLPLDYGAGLRHVLFAIWLGLALVYAVRNGRRRHRSPAPGSALPGRRPSRSRLPDQYE